MALFKNESNEIKDMETIIGSSVKVEGNFNAEGNVNVEGVVQGSLKTNHHLKVGSKAKIKAEVEADNLFLAGEIRGNIKVKEKTQLSQTAKIFGNLETKILSVEEGAVINGKCTMSSEASTPEKKTEKSTIQ